MKKIKVLNLYAGIGGNRKLWTNVDVTAVEKNKEIAKIYKELYPNDIMLIEDAHEYLLYNYDQFDFIWASPPCQSHSLVNNFLHSQKVRRYPDVKLWQEIIYLKKFSEYNNNKIKWAVENVKPYYNFIPQNFIINRHYFWSNILIKGTKYKTSKISVINAKQKTRRTINDHRDSLFKIHQIPKNKNIKTEYLTNCVDPKIGLYIFKQMQQNKSEENKKIKMLETQQSRV